MQDSLKNKGEFVMKKKILGLALLGAVLSQGAWAWTQPNCTADKPCTFTLSLEPTVWNVITPDWPTDVLSLNLWGVDGHNHQFLGDMKYTPNTSTPPSSSKTFKLTGSFDQYSYVSIQFCAPNSGTSPQYCVTYWTKLLDALQDPSNPNAFTAPLMQSARAPKVKDSYPYFCYGGHPDATGVCSEMPNANGGVMDLGDLRQMVTNRAMAKAKEHKEKDRS